MLQYDNSAFYFFAMSILSFYLLPCKYTCDDLALRTLKLSGTCMILVLVFQTILTWSILLPFLDQS